MARIDWSEIEWWDLPGPAGFLRDAADRIASDAVGIVGVSLPSLRPKGLLDALAAHVEEEIGLRAILLDAASFDPGQSPAHALAAAAGAQPGEIRSTKDFITAPQLADYLFILDAISLEAWDVWSLFLRTFRTERIASDRLAAPRLVIVQPAKLPPGEAAVSLGRDILQWKKIVTRSDMQLYVETLLGPGDDLVHRTSVATITETACWDPDLAQLLAGRGISDRLNPTALLSGANLQNLGEPCWSNGLVDIWDGGAHVHTLALVGQDGGELLTRRIWRAHVGAIFPAVELVRQTFVRRYFDELQAQMPIQKQFHQTVRTYNHPLELEINDVAYYLRDQIPIDEKRLLYHFKDLRTAMAHMEPANAQLIVQASTAWNAFAKSATFNEEAMAWQWPRCGQRLVLLVGPSGAGKSTYASKTYLTDEILSSDAIREELFGTSDMGGNQEHIFQLLRVRAQVRLSSGRSAVIDATNIRQRDRIANALLVPRDIPVDYILIDRPMSEKERDAGWRAEKPDLLENHARLFARELPHILAGDELPNVVVHDMRTGI